MSDITLQEIIDAIERGAFDSQPNANVLIIGAFARRGKGNPLLSHEVPPLPKVPAILNDVEPFLVAVDSWLDIVKPLEGHSGFPMQVNRCAVELHGKLHEIRDNFTLPDETREHFIATTKRLLFDVFAVPESLQEGS